MRSSRTLKAFSLAKSGTKFGWIWPIGREEEVYKVVSNSGVIKVVVTIRGFFDLNGAKLIKILPGNKSKTNLA